MPIIACSLQEVVISTRLRARVRSGVVHHQHSLLAFLRGESECEQRATFWIRRALSQQAFKVGDGVSCFRVLGFERLLLAAFDICRLCMSPIGFLVASNQQFPGAIP